MTPEERAAKLQPYVCECGETSPDKCPRLAAVAFAIRAAENEARRELLEILRDVEFGSRMHEGTCGICGPLKDSEDVLKAHDPDCSLVAALKTPGGGR